MKPARFRIHESGAAYGTAFSSGTRMYPVFSPKPFLTDGFITSHLRLLARLTFLCATDSEDRAVPFITNAFLYRLPGLAPSAKVFISTMLFLVPPTSMSSRKLKYC